MRKQFTIFLISIFVLGLGYIYFTRDVSAMRVPQKALCTLDDWRCEDWSTCSSEGIKTRACSKITNCEDNSSYTPPATTLSCSTSGCVEDTWSCGNWGDCSINGEQTRTCTETFDCELVDTPPSSTAQSCTYVPPICTSWQYSNWSQCLADGSQTRTIVSSLPNNCSGGNPILTQSCTYVPACTLNDWSCTDWGTCSYGGSQVRTCSKTSNCDGGVSSPITAQTCTFFPSCTISDWSCSGWSICAQNGKQTRICVHTPRCQNNGVPSPTMIQDCTNTTACTANDWSCSDWGDCSSSGRQSRSCNKISNCVGGVLSPKIIQSCTYTPSCTEDTWQCGNWGTCSPQGVQTRSCRKTYDCPSEETAAPSTSQYCEALNQPKLQSPTEDLGIVNQDSIVKSTVKLICPVSTTMASQGSGTIVDSRGTILTNKHVIDGTPGCLVGFIDSYGDEPYFGDRQIADIYKVSSDADIAVLKLRNPNNRSITSIDIARGNSNSLRLGDQMTTYGYPAKFGTKITYTSGDFSGVDGSYLKTTAIIEHGNSGGGAYLKNGTFVGIPTAVIKGSLNSMGYVLSINKINGWLNNSVIAYNNDSNNNYSRVSILEDIDLNTLGSLNLFIPDNKQTSPSASAKKDNQKVVKQKTLASTIASLSVRKSPSSKAKVVWSIKKGKSYAIIGAQGDWYQIKISNKLSGWVMKKYVKMKK